VDEFNAQELANTACAFAHVGQDDAPLFAALARAAERRVGECNDGFLSYFSLVKENLRFRIKLLKKKTKKSKKMRKSSLKTSAGKLGMIYIILEYSRRYPSTYAAAAAAATTAAAAAAAAAEATAAAAAAAAAATA